MSGALFPSPAVKPLGYGQLASLGSAVLLSTVTGGIPAGANYALIQAITANVNWTDDGSVPTSSAGMALVAGADPQGFVGPQLATLQLIAASGSPKVNVSFYKLD